MAGMFYSLKEAAETLGKTQDEVRQMAEQGQLRVFRDGSNLLFKIDEVHALLAEGAKPADVDLDALDLESGEELMPEPADEDAGPPLDDSLEQDIFKVDDEELPALEPAAEDDGLAELELPAPEEEEDALAGLELPAAEQDEAASSLGLAPAEADAGSELELPAEAADASAELELPAEQAEASGELPTEGADASSEMELAIDAADASSEMELTAESGAQPALDQTGEEELFVLDEDQTAAGSTAGTEEEISLAPESGMLGEGSDITDMDTALTGAGVNVLGESSSGYDVTDDSMAETAGPAGTGAEAEASLEEIEDDVNLDSFGSGSGLLDLSLQADDTSLGGILDEIYTAEGGEEERAPAAAEEEGEQASFDEITAEVDHAPAAAEEEAGVPEPVAVMPVMAGAVYAEAVPDTQSNMLGMLLFLPLLALLYTAIVAVAGLKEVVPSILKPIQGLIWPIVIGAILVAAIVSGASFVVGGERAPKAAKVKKEKVKVEKTKKEKASKVEKPAKPEKPVRQKKSFFGKKK